jgi:hypothetical protein
MTISGLPIKPNDLMERNCNQTSEHSFHLIVLTLLFEKQGVQKGQLLQISVL